MASQQTEPKRKEEERASAPSLLDRIVEQQQEVASRYKPVMSIADLIEREKAIQYLVDNVMVEGIDYGWIPGTKPKEEAKPGEYKAKPTLFKAGAERACSFFGYYPQFPLQTAIEEWGSDTYGEPLFYYRFECTLFKDGHIVGSGIGSATTWESKYRYRNAERTCPACSAANIRKSKPKPGQEGPPGFYCWEKTGGCGATFAADDEAITGQEMGKTANPDIADAINTVQKMAQKRAYVAATLTATGLSGRFTQDLEDMPMPKAAKPAQTQPEPEARKQPNGKPQSRPVPKELTKVFANIDHDVSAAVDAYSRLEWMFIQKGGDSGYAEYNRIADMFNQKYPKGTSDKAAHKEFLLNLWDALQAIKPAEPVQEPKGE